MNGDEHEAKRQYASPPCFAHEIDPVYLGLAPTPSAPPGDVARWRRAERARLVVERTNASAAARSRAAEALARSLDTLLARWDWRTDAVLSGYWPVGAEPDLRLWLVAQHEAGAAIALPVAVTDTAPLIFRRWRPEDRMRCDDCGVPAPPSEAAHMAPDIVLVPLLGWDPTGYGLGRGGGRFDRTLRALSPRPFAIGVGLQRARLETIHPQPHDVRLDAIVTETGIKFDEAQKRQIAPDDQDVAG